MKKNQLGLSDLFVSELGLGCMSLGSNREAAIPIIHEALERGINFFDTADLYDYGLNEEILGEAIKDRRGHMILATKVGNRWNDDKNGWYWDPSKKYIKEQVKASLKRLKTDYIDLYQLHGGTIEDPIDETIEAFEELKSEGWIRYYGISSIRPNVMKQFVQRSNIVSVMMQYSLLDRRPEELFPLLEEHSISVIARGPLAKGLLTERFQEKATEKIADNGYLSYSFDEVIKMVSSIKAMLEPSQSVNELALKYPLHHPTVATIIPGASRIEQLIENVKAVTQNDLSEAVYKQLQAITKPITYTQHRI